MNLAAGFFFFFVGFILLLIPIACVVLLTLILRRQGDQQAHLDDLREAVFDLNRAVNRMTKAEADPADGASTTKSNRHPTPADTAPSPKLPAKPASVPCLSASMKESQAAPIILRASETASTGDQPAKLAAQKPSSPSGAPPTPPAPSRPGAPKQPVQQFPRPRPSQPAKPPPLEPASASLLGRLWNWFLFGADQLPENTTIEYAVATHWLLRIGILISVLCVGFFLKYSLEKNWINDAGRCLLSVIVGLGMMGIGLKLKGKRFNLPGMGLLGGGLVVLYWSVYAAHVMYGLLPQVWALPAMILITVCAGALAVWLRSPLVAIIGIIGGYGSPVVMHLQSADVFSILIYMLILGVGILGISFWRNWHLLNYLGLLFTYGLTLSLQNQFKAENFARIFPLLLLFFVLYAGAMHIHNFVRKRRSTFIELAGQVINALMFFWLAGDLIKNLFSKDWTAVLSVGLALFFFIYLLVLNRSNRKDPGLEITLTGLSAFFLTISMPIVLSGDWLTPAWALQALIMLWAAGKLRSPFLRGLAYALYIVMFSRMMTVDLAREFDWASVSGSQHYWTALRERFLVFLVPVFSLFGGYLIQRKPLLTAGVGSQPNATRQGQVPRLFFWLALLFSFFILNVEFRDFYRSLYQPALAPGLTLLWVVLLAYLIFRTARQDSQAALPLLVLFGALLFFKILLFDLQAWGFDPDNFTCGSIRYDRTAALMRGLDFSLIVALMLGAFSLLPRKKDSTSRIMKTVFGFLGLGVLFFYLTLELNTALGIYKEGFRAGAISILWSVFAISFLLSGLRRNQAGLRYIGLVLFAIIVVKVFFSDLAQLDPLFRIVAFGALGIIVTGGSFAYLFFRQSVEKAPPPQHD